MQTTGRIARAGEWNRDKIYLPLVLDSGSDEEIADLSKEDRLEIRITKKKKRRSLDANALLWACIGEISQALRADKWAVYLLMLRRYGKFTYICVKPQVVEAVKLQWRECEEIGKVNINGTEAVQLLCYFGSSTYNSKEFSVLLDGVISEMKDIGLTPPPPKHIEEALKKWTSNSTAQG